MAKTVVFKIPTKTVTPTPSSQVSTLDTAKKEKATLKGEASKPKELASKKNTPKANTSSEEVKTKKGDSISTGVKGATAYGEGLGPRFLHVFYTLQNL